MNPDPLTGEMKWRDAAIVATVLMFLFMCTVFMPSYTYEVIEADVPHFTFEVFKFAATAWITAFASLTGLTAYAKSKQES